MELKIVHLKMQDSEQLSKIFAKTFCQLNQLWKLLGATEEDAYKYIIGELQQCIKNDLAYGVQINGQIVGGITFVDMVDYVRISNQKKQSEIKFLDKLKIYADKLQKNIKNRQYKRGEYIYFTNIFIHPNYAKGGLASKVMVCGYKIIKERGYKYTLGRASNPATTRAGLRIGGKIVDQIMIPELGESFTFMQMPIDNPVLNKLLNDMFGKSQEKKLMPSL